MLNELDIICGEMTGEGPVWDTEMIRSHFLKLLKNSTWSVENVNKVPQEEIRECVQQLFIKSWLSTWLSLSKRL